MATVCWPNTKYSHTRFLFWCNEQYTIYFFFFLGCCCCCFFFSQARSLGRVAASSKTSWTGQGSQGSKLNRLKNGLQERRRCIIPRLGLFEHQASCCQTSTSIQHLYSVGYVPMYSSCRLFVQSHSPIVLVMFTVAASLSHALSTILILQKEVSFLFVGTKECIANCRMMLEYHLAHLKVRNNLQLLYFLSAPQYLRRWAIK